MSTLKFKVGDVCMTQGSRVPLLNDNQMVVVVRIEPNKARRDGESTPYGIERVDGQLHPSTVNADTGMTTTERLGASDGL